MQKSKIQISYALRPLMGLMIALCILCTHTSCEDTMGVDCEANISNFSLSTNSFEPGETISGSVSVIGSIDLDDVVTLRTIVSLYLSTDNVVDDSDIILSAFVDNAASGDGILTYDQIYIPFDLPEGNYSVIAHIIPQACSDGTFTVEDTEKKNVFVGG